MYVIVLNLRLCCGPRYMYIAHSNLVHFQTITSISRNTIDVAINVKVKQMFLAASFKITHTHTQTLQTLCQTHLAGPTALIHVA